MAGTYSKIYIQIVFAVKGRKNLIKNEWKNELHKNISGIIKKKGHKPIIVGGMPDHIQVFVGMKPAMAISDLVRDMKNNSTNCINENKFTKENFLAGRVWRILLFAFSYWLFLQLHFNPGTASFDKIIQG